MSLKVKGLIDVSQSQERDPYDSWISYVKLFLKFMSYLSYYFMLIRVVSLFYSIDDESKMAKET